MGAGLKVVALQCVPLFTDVTHSSHSVIIQTCCNVFCSRSVPPYLHLYPFSFSPLHLWTHISPEKFVTHFFIAVYHIPYTIIHLIPANFFSIFDRAALLATQVLPSVCRGDVYKQIEWVLVDAHTQLLELLTKKQGNEELIASRCQRLSALIFNSTISGNYKLLELQEAVIL